jgi:hypothetical protein
MSSLTFLRRSARAPQKLILLALLGFSYRSEAFASSYSRFAGQRIRGGAAPRQKTDGSTPLQCVMQMPPIKSSSSSNDESSNLQKLNGVKKVRPVEFVAETKLPTDMGQFQLRAYRVPGAPIGQEPCVIYSRDNPPFGKEHVPVRIHDQCLTSEVFRSQR